MSTFKEIYGFKKLGEEKVSCILKKARALIAKEEDWSTEACARDALGKVVDPFSASACKFCSVGAISVATANYTREEARSITEPLIKVTGNLGYFNDTSSHKEVLEAWDQAIAFTEEKELWDKALSEGEELEK